jgi:tetratricopeptide (TPR) repeat protein
MRAGNKPARAASRGAFNYADDQLHKLWEKLHHGDREPWPEPKAIARLGTKNAAFAAWLAAHGGAAAVAQGMQAAWREFHAGNFPKAIKLGSDLGALGAVVANKAAAIASVNAPRNAAQRRKSLETAAKRGEASVELLPEYPNAHYMLALVLGRYSQDISIIKAVATGLATRVRTHLERTLALEPSHAEAHVALGLYHAELVKKLGMLAASLTYGASQDHALEHFRRAVKLAPASPIVHIEYANGLMLLDAARNRQQAEALYAQAAAFQPIDAMEQLDVERAKRGIE